MDRINLLRARVERIDFQKKKLFTTNDEAIEYDKLLLATGSKSNKFGWPGQELDGVQGLYHYQDLEAMQRQTPGLNRVVVVGGGLIGVEMAEMFHSRGIPVTFLVRESDFWNVVLPPEESGMVSRHLREHHIDLRLETELKEIQPDNTGKKCAAVVTNKGEKIDCGFVGLAVGVSPNVDFLHNTELETNRGILVNEFLETNIPDVYAAGDCAELRFPLPGRMPIEAVWYTGRIMGETVAHNLIAEYGIRNTEYGMRNTECGMRNTECGMRNAEYGMRNAECGMRNAECGIRNAESERVIPHSAFPIPHSYNPGVWFNSAKFFDIEYQIYGDIQPQLPDNQATLYWEHPDGKKSIRINYEVERSAAGKPLAGKVVGFNLMGVRYRHEVCDKWIRSGAHIEDVLQQLGMANFDPEFSAEHDAELVKIYNRQTGKNLKLKQSRGLPAVQEFLRQTHFAF